MEARDVLDRQDLEKDDAMFSEKQKADAFDDLAPELAELHDVCARFGCPAGERFVPWVAQELDRLTTLAQNTRMDQFLAEAKCEGLQGIIERLTNELFESTIVSLEVRQLRGTAGDQNDDR
jgi:hypothetical protein